MASTTLPFPGWIQYGSYYNEKNTWWPYWKLLNDYRARMGALVRNADMHTDIAILPANADLWSTMGVQTEPFPVKLNIPYFAGLGSDSQEWRRCGLCIREYPGKIHRQKR